MGESANHRFRWRLEFQEIEMSVAYHHFQDWQRGTINEFVRAFLGLGDYYVLDKFRTDQDKEWAEHYLARVAGPTLRQTLDMLEDRPDNLPIHQGVDQERGDNARMNLSDTFESMDTEVNTRYDVIEVVQSNLDDDDEEEGEVRWQGLEQDIELNYMEQEISLEEENSLHLFLDTTEDQDENEEDCVKNLRTRKPTSYIEFSDHVDIQSKLDDILGTEEDD
jgi:hypothetical protein